MQKLINGLVSALSRGENVALLTIIERSGSAPRGVGACMAVYSNGSARGTIGGGAIEYQAVLDAKSLLNACRCETRSYRLRNDEAGDLGMVCGGEVTVLIHPIHPDTVAARVLLDANDCVEAGQTVTLVRRIVDGSLAGIELIRETYGKAVLERDGEGVIELIEPIGETGHVYLFGGGHVSRALCPVLTSVNFRVIVLEDREEFASRERFETAEKLVVGTFSELANGLTLAPSDSVVVMTRGHQSDYEVLAGVLKTRAGYIGCIGSRNKVAATRQRLLDDGFTDEDFARVHTPIGLSIGAETPAEIAVSIAAEMIQYRAGH